MKVLIFLHCGLTPSYQYIFDGFVEDVSVTEVVVVGLSEVREHAVFNVERSAGIRQGLGAEKIRFVALPSMGVRQRWFRWRDVRKIVGREEPDILIVLDEPLSLNTLWGGLAIAWHGLLCPTFCYSFQNLYESPPWALLKSPNRDVSAFIRKSIRFGLLDWAGMVIRPRLIAGGLYAYAECLDILARFGWTEGFVEGRWPVDVKQLRRPSKAIRSELVEQLRASGRPLIGYVGRLEPEKGVGDLLELSRRPEASSWQFVFVGDGCMRDEIESRSLMDLNITLVPPVSKSELAGLYAGFDILVVPSRTTPFWKEQLGRVVGEAQICGCCVVGSNSGAIPFVVNDPDLIFSEGDLSSMFAVLKNALQRPEITTRESYGQRWAPHCFSGNYLSLANNKKCYEVI